MFFNGRRDSCDNTRLSLIKAQLAAGVIMATTCLVYLILYCIVASRISRADRRQAPAVVDAVMAPVYQQPLTSTINYQHQPYANSPHLYQPSAPVMVPAYPTMYPTIPNDRF